MASDPLIEELLVLIGQPHNVKTRFADWRQRCANHLHSLPPAQRSIWMGRIQTILAENRTLFEQESQDIFDTLVKTPPSPQKAAQAKKYRSVRDL